MADLLDLVVEGERAPTYTWLMQRVRRRADGEERMDGERRAARIRGILEADEFGGLDERFRGELEAIAALLRRWGIEAECVPSA